MCVSFLCVEPATTKKQISTKNTESSGITVIFNDFQQICIDNDDEISADERTYRFQTPGILYSISMVVSASYIVHGLLIQNCLRSMKCQLHPLIPLYQNPLQIKNVWGYICSVFLYFFLYTLTDTGVPQKAGKGLL